MEQRISVNQTDSKVLLSEINWGVALASSLIAITIYVSLLMLGSSLGLAIMDFEDGISFSAASWSIGVWHILFAGLAVFAGSYMAGRLSRSFSFFAGAINGLLVWSVMSLFAVYFIGSGLIYTGKGIGAATGGVAGVVSNIISDVNPMASSRLSNELGLDEINFEQLKNRIEEIKAPELKAEVRQEVSRLSQSVTNAFVSVAKNPNGLDAEVSQLGRKFESSAQRMSDSMTEARLEGILAQNSSMSRTEISAIAENWKQTFQRMSQAFQDKLPEVKAQLRDWKNEAVDTADEATNIVAAGFGIIFAMLAIGFVIAIFGGYLGARASKINVIK